MEALYAAALIAAAIGGYFIGCFMSGDEDDFYKVAAEDEYKNKITGLMEARRRK